MSGRRPLVASLEPDADLHMVAAVTAARTGTLTVTPDPARSSL
jgi:hypothetical protein